MNLWLHQKLFSKCCWPCYKSSRLQPKADSIVRASFFFHKHLKTHCLKSHIATHSLQKVNTDTNEFRRYNICASWIVPNSCSWLWVNLAQLHDIYTGQHKVKDFIILYLQNSNRQLIFPYFYTISFLCCVYPKSLSLDNFFWAICQPVFLIHDSHEFTLTSNLLYISLKHN